MNKLLTKIVGVALGATMAIGVGVAVANSDRGVSKADAATVVSTLTFTAKCDGSGTADDGTIWTVTSDGTESTYDSTKGIHYGTNNASVQYIQLSTSSISGTVTKIVVNASGNNSPSLSCTVGGEAFGTTATGITNTATEYTFNGSGEAGEIVVRLDKGSKLNKAIYIKSVAVTYTTGGSTPSSGDSYSKITAAPSDWSGTYLLVYQSGSTGYVWTGVDAANCYEEVAIAANKIDQALSSAVTITIASYSTGYSIQVNGGTNDGKYISGTSGSNTLNFGALEVANTISYDSGVEIVSNTSHLRFNDASGNMRFRYFKATSYSSQKVCQLFKLDSKDPAIELTITEGTATLGVGDTATVTATKINGATGTITWDTYDDKVSLGTPTTTDLTSSVVVTGVLGGEDIVVASLAGCDDAELSFTVVKELASIAVTTAPTKTTYTEGESFDPTGMVVTATYDDGTTSTPSDYTYSPAGALTPSVNEITISYSYGGGEAKTTTQSITVNAKAVDHIKIKSLPTKHEYHADDEFVATGLKITVCYNAAETDILDDVDTGFTISPSTYTFTSADENNGSKEFTVTYGGKSTTFNVTVKGVTGVIPNGNYYIMHIGSDGVDYGAANVYNDTATHPTGVDLSVANTLGCFTFTLTDTDDVYIVKSGSHFLYCTNTNNGAFVGATEDTWTVEKVEHTSSEIADGEYDYYTMEDTTNSRYLTSYVTGTANDFRSYSYNSTYFGKERVNNGQHARLMLVPEAYYVNEIVDAILDSNSPLCNGGSTAPNVNRWNDIADITYIENELSVLRGTTAAAKNAQGETPSGTDAEKAMARYDEIMVRYNTVATKTYVDFLGRISAQNLVLKASSGIILGFTSETNAPVVVIIISMITLTAVGGYFFMRKKKEQ